MHQKLASFWIIFCYSSHKIFIFLTVLFMFEASFEYVWKSVCKRKLHKSLSVRWIWYDKKFKVLRPRQQGVPGSGISQGPIFMVKVKCLYFLYFHLYQYIIVKTGSYGIWYSYKNNILHTHVHTVHFYQFPALFWITFLPLWQKITYEWVQNLTYIHNKEYQSKNF